MPNTYRSRLVALFATATTGFVAISLDVTQHGILERHDSRVGLWFVVHTPTAVERIANVITKLGGAWSLISLTVLGTGLLLRRGNRTDAVLLVGGVVLASLATNGLKIAFARPRPTIGDLAPASYTASFPSGHTSGSMVVFVLLAVFLATSSRRAVVAVAAGLAALVGVTRVVVAAHWTTDVLAGYCLGIAVVAGVLLVRDRCRPEGERDGEQSGKEERDLGRPPVADDRLGEAARVDDVSEPGRDARLGR